MKINAEVVAARIQEFIRNNVDAFERDGVILGMSGGIDSSVVGILAARALGPEKVLALLLPERDSSPDSKTDALDLINDLQIEWREVNLTPMLSAIGIYKMMPLRFLGTRRIKETVVKAQHQRQAEALGEPPFLAGLLGTRRLGERKQLIDAGNAYARVKHRMRLTMLYYYADLENRLVLGTTNKSEALTGFVVKWGDNVADIEPILPLFKTQVRQLATYLDVPQTVMDKPPTPDLLPGINDELALGISYSVLDQVLLRLERGDSQSAIAVQVGVEDKTVAQVEELMRRSAHTREMPPTPEL